MPEWDDMVLVGTIARTHGLRGDVIVNPATDFVDERFKPGAEVWTRHDGRETRLVVGSVRVQNGRPVIGFEGFDSVTAAEPLAGRELRVPESALRPLEQGTYYHHQLTGCVVETTGGATVGPVVRVEEGAGGALLVVDGTTGEVLIPLAADICVTIDVDARRIRIEPLEGLLELNVTARSAKRR
jgi:16S rRNA processing protein RimM